MILTRAPGERGDFHQIQTPFIRGRDRFVDRQHAPLVAVSHTRTGLIGSAD